MLADVFIEMFDWFYLVLTTLIQKGGYIGMAIVLFPFLRKVCSLFKQLTN